GGLVTDMRYEALKERIVINGLPIMNDRPNPFGFPNETDLDRYYLHCVTGGPRPFLAGARNLHDFPPPLRHKPPHDAAHPRPPAPCARSSCRKWPTAVRAPISTSPASGCATARSWRRAGGRGACATTMTTPSSSSRSTSSAATSASGAAVNSGSAASA